MDTKKTQQLITGALVLVLLALVGGYIYYGMYLAKKGDPSAQVQTEESTSTNSSSALMTSEQKIEILKSLSESAGTTTTTSLADREKILNSLSASNENGSTAPKMSEDQKLKILESLKN